MNATFDAPSLPAVRSLPPRTRRTLARVCLALLIALPCIALATPPSWAPAHGWRKKNDPSYAGYSGRQWERDYGVRSGRCDRSEIGAVLGGVAGGVIGSEVGKGDNRGAAIVVGTVIGAAIGYEIGRRMDVTDRSCVGHALELTEILRAHFWDAGAGGFFFTPDDGEKLLVRPKELYDGAIPSGNSIAFANLLRLARLTGRPDLEETAWQASRIFSDALERSPSAFTHFLAALSRGLAPSSEVVVTGPPDAPGTAALLQAVRRAYLPETSLLYVPSGEAGAALAEIVPFVRELPRRDGPAAYVCRGFACQAPVLDPASLRKALGLAE